MRIRAPDAVADGRDRYAVIDQRSCNIADEVSEEPRLGMVPEPPRLSPGTDRNEYAEGHEERSALREACRRFQDVPKDKDTGHPKPEDEGDSEDQASKPLIVSCKECA